MVALLVSHRFNAAYGTDVKERFINDGLEPIGGTQEAFARFIREEIDQYAKVIKAAGIKPL
jgi:tripartite-type tricarboxylate transporter receptor subunit TctC